MLCEINFYKTFLNWSACVTVLETSCLNADMRKIESSQQEESWVQGRTQGGFGVTLPPWAWFFTKTLLPALRKGDSLSSHTFCLLICRLSGNTTKWICMQISNNVVNGPKSNNLVLMGIWVILCVQKPSLCFLQTFRPLCMFEIVFRDSSLYPKQLPLFSLLRLISASADRIARAYARGRWGG